MFGRQEISSSSRLPLVARRHIARGMVARADALRDAKRYSEAAVLYDEALRLAPDNAGIQIQCGHMYKEAGNFAEAERHYDAALSLTPNDPDLSLQIGHFNKVRGSYDKAVKAYRKALQLRPDWAEAKRELDTVGGSDWDEGISPEEAHAEGPFKEEEIAAAAAFWHMGDDTKLLSHMGDMDSLALEVAPRRANDLVRRDHERIDVRRCGLWERTFWGMMRTLRGVQAVRGFCISATPLVEFQININGLMFHRGPLRGGYPLEGEREPSELRKYVFNEWLDFSGFAYGRYGLDFRFIDANGNVRTHHEGMTIAAPRREEDYPDSDGFVSIDPADPRSIADQVFARPSMVRPSQRQLFARPIRTVLVQRVDQLGDLVCSVPAIRRLREVFPEARLVGLLSPANHELAASLKLFDDIVITDFPDIWEERRRVMPLDRQMELRKTLLAYDIDLAIDLSDSGVSRPLLFLTGAPYRFGFRYAEFPWMIAGFEGGTHDIANGNERVPHTTKVMGLIEWLAALSKSHARVEPRTDLSRALLTPLGLGEHDRFVLMHTGARLVYSRWPHYHALARKVLAETDLTIVMLTDDRDERAKLPPDLAGSDRLILIDHRLTFDAFDALVCFCAAFVGNDSGPKHLASLRGANVVSLHMARNNWNEWGQENKGFVISRKVPCAGCSIHHEPDECGKDYACITHITPDEVFDALKAML